MLVNDTHNKLFNEFRNRLLSKIKENLTYTNTNENHEELIKNSTEEFSLKKLEPFKEDPQVNLDKAYGKTYNFTIKHKLEGSINVLKLIENAEKFKINEHEKTVEFTMNFEGTDALEFKRKINAYFNSTVNPPMIEANQFIINWNTKLRGEVFSCIGECVREENFLREIGAKR